MHSVLSVGMLLICGSVLAESDFSMNWKELRAKNLELGVPAAQVDQTLETCRKRGLSARDADVLLCSAYIARAESLPFGCIYTRIEEGLAKQVEVSRVTSAAELRLNCLRQARELTTHLYGESTDGRGGGPAHLLEHAAMALESGLPSDVLQEVFLRNGRRRIGRLAHVVEAAETLQLAGLAPDQIQRVMIDFLDRDLTRNEVMRAIRVLRDGLAAGGSFENVYAALWVLSE